MAETTRKTQRQAKPAHARATKPAGKTKDASESAKATPARSPFAQIQEAALVLEEKLARYGQKSDAEEYLAAARVVEALRLILATPLTIPSQAAIHGGEKGPGIDPRTLAGGIGKAASDLRSLAQKWGAPVDGKGRYPDGPARVDKGACALREGLARALAADPNADPALIVEGLRFAFIGEGSLTVLPHMGTSQERIRIFRSAIDSLRTPRATGASCEDIGIRPIDLATAENVDFRPMLRDRPFEPKDAEAIVNACARACGNKRENFGAERKQVKR